MAGEDTRGGWRFLLVRMAWRPFLAVVVVLGVVLAVMLFAPQPRDTIEKDYVASMKFDLRNLVTAEASYFTDHATYTATLGNLAYSVAAGDTVAIGSATSTGWAATAKNNGTTHTCGIYVGAAAAPVRGQKEGEPKCL